MLRIAPEAFWRTILQSHCNSPTRQRQGRATVRRFRPELLPPAKNFYEKEFGRLRRACRGWTRVHCCFHFPDKDPSLSINVTTGAFHCFACGEHGGDIVAFTMLHDGLDFKTAAKLLGAWDGTLEIDAVIVRKVEAAHAQREEERRTEAELERTYCAAESWLYRIEEIYRESSTRLSELRQGATPAFPDEEETLWDILGLALDEIRSAETAYVRVRLAWPNAPHNSKARDWNGSRR